MDLRHFRYFSAVADEGSVSEAARNRLHTAQPSLSRQLKDLERELGVELFERRVRGVVLTRAGRVFLSHVRRILRQVDDAVSAVRDAPLTIRVGIIPGLETFVLPDFMRLARDHSGEVEIEVTSNASTALIQDLRDGELDLAFARPAETDLDLHFEPIGHSHVIAYLREDHPLAALEALTFNDLVGHTCISVNRKVAPFLRGGIDAWGQQRGLALSPTHVAADIASVFSLILATNGVALMPDYAALLLPASVIVRPLVDGPAPLLLTIAYRPLGPSPTQRLIAAVARDWPRATQEQETPASQDAGASLATRK
ncbi:LysR family transcriptional regulator [Oryzibacter oryziterrae]|uniref:LysR family transcriptional regulator n=1 Tax=Oryzibacter oryziterrae TaxID=2766474 RepID=UPI001F35905E|nr:LysR substrate-binding domain-containing protein [Oryzibacter oryziterrae]